jgi:hypothetical protein
LVESFAAESLRREEVRIEALEDFWIVSLIFLKERILFNRCDELAGLGINLGLIGSLNLEEPDPSLKIKEFTLLGRGNAAALEGDFEESLSLGRNKLIQVDRLTADFAKGLRGGIATTLRSPITEKNKRHPDNREKEKK